MRHLHAAIMIAAALALASSSIAQDAPAGSTLAIDWQTIDGGGGVSVAGSLRLVSTIGQPDPGACSAGTFVLSGGFIPGAVEPVDPCPADFNDDAMIDVLDLLALLGAWGPCASCPEDTNDDGEVDVIDLLDLLGAWGACPAP